ncbi:RING finger protein [Anatilimnocola aggregata]|uniref:RING finger protein n=1 Tax=Anatilimnocola aggregata TaxID=2528021 RepID=UPI00192E4F67|nr:RING finger protein [Anatilimnocola aggregata]
MDNFFPIVVIMAFVAIVIVISALTQANRRQSLEAVAHQFRGSVQEGNWFSYPEATFRLGGTTARLHYTKRGKHGRSTHLTIPFPDPRLRLEIYQQDLVQQMKKLLGMEDIEIGSHEFDNAFIISGSHRKVIREYLTRDAQLAIQTLAHYSAGFSPDLYLLVANGSLRITKRANFQTEAELTRFLRLAEQVFTALVASRQTGIEFISPVTTQAPPETQCQVCGESLAEKIVYCTSCQTPHHLDCWQYFGSCSVYACGQKKYRLAKK